MTILVILRVIANDLIKLFFANLYILVAPQICNLWLFIALVMCLVHSLITSHAFDTYLNKLYCYIITLTNIEELNKMKQTTKEKYAEINQNIFNSNLFSRLDTLNDNLKTFNEIMSSLLFIVIKDSTLKTMTTNEIEKISPIVNSVAKTINKNINV